MSTIPAPLIESGDERTPVTVWLTPAQATRLELFLARQREADPAIDENGLVDKIFSRGLEVTEICP